MKIQAPHAPGAGSDKQHPETPPDANEKFREENEREFEEFKKSHPHEMPTKK